MTKTGWRDGTITANKVIVDEKVPVQYSLASVAAVATGAMLSSNDFNATGTAAMTRTGLLLQPPYPMCVTVTKNVAGTADDSDALAIVGINAKGKVVSENVTISSATGRTVTSNAFAEITSITPNATIKSTSIALGFSSTIGLPWPIAGTSDIMTYSYLGEFGTSAKVSGTLVVDPVYDTIDVPTLGASGTLHILYKTKLQE